MDIKKLVEFPNLTQYLWLFPQFSSQCARGDANTSLQLNAAVCLHLKCIREASHTPLLYMIQGLWETKSLAPLINSKLLIMKSTDKMQPTNVTRIVCQD